MGLEERVADLERRLAALERVERAESADRDEGGPRHVPDTDVWVLEGLKARLAEAGPAAAAGAVLFTGAVRLPTQERYEWQYGLPADDLLADDWSDAADGFAALGQPVRLRLLREILLGRRTAAELTELEGVGTTGQIYHHLRQLVSAGWLHTAARGRYEIPAGRVIPLLVMLTAARP